MAGIVGDQNQLFGQNMCGNQRIRVPYGGALAPEGAFDVAKVVGRFDTPLQGRESQKKLSISG